MLITDGFIPITSSPLMIQDPASGAGGCQLKTDMMLAWDTFVGRHRLAVGTGQNRRMLFNIYRGD